MGKSVLHTTVTGAKCTRVTGSEGCGNSDSYPGAPPPTQVLLSLLVTPLSVTSCRNVSPASYHFPYLPWPLLGVPWTPAPSSHVGNPYIILK